MDGWCPILVIFLIVVDGVPSWSFFLLLWMVSHPGLIFYDDGWCPILVTAPKLCKRRRQEFIMFVLLCPLFYLAPQDILVTAPKYARGWDGPYFYIARRDPRDLTSISLYLSSKITKPDAMRCHGTRGCKRCPSTSLY